MIKKVPWTKKKHLNKLKNIKRKCLKNFNHNKKVLFHEKKKIIVMFIAF